MTTIIRSARLAPETKTVPVPNLQAEVRKIPIQVQPPAAPPVVPTYEEYKQRLAGELAALRQQAMDSGRDEGLQQGRQIAEAQYKKELETLRLLIESVHAARQRYIEDIGDDAMEIAFVAITKILGESFATREAALAAVQEAIRCCKQRGRLLVKVAPPDFELLNGKLSDVELVPDEHVRWGGCVLEGSSGNLDARLETQVQRLRDTLVAARAKWS